MKNFSVLIGLVVLLACEASVVAVEDISKVPTVTTADEAFADVFKPMEGKWVGELKFFEDLSPSERNMDILEHPSTGYLRTPSMKLQGRAKVERSYQSESPYFQRVQVKETYYDEADVTLETSEYEGVQKVQNGKLWAISKIAADSTVVLKGTPIQDGFAWKRSALRPKMQEYFEARTKSNVHEILGFAYRKGDDRKKMPRYWYYERYERSEK